jgi:hypothetical protein
MATFKDTIMIKDRPYDRAVEVIVTYPNDMNVTNHRRSDGEGACVRALRRLSFPCAAVRIRRGFSFPKVMPDCRLWGQARKTATAKPS